MNWFMDEQHNRCSVMGKCGGMRRRERRGEGKLKGKREEVEAKRARQVERSDSQPPTPGGVSISIPIQTPLST